MPRVLSYEEISPVAPDHWAGEVRPLVIVSALLGDAAALQRRLCDYFPQSTTLPSLRELFPFKLSAQGKSSFQYFQRFFERFF